LPGLKEIMILKRIETNYTRNMTTLIFLGTSIAILILLSKVAIKLVHHKSITPTLKSLAIVISSYTFLWILFYFLSTYKPVPLGTDICFDDWCATITGFEKPVALEIKNSFARQRGEFVILHIKMSNHARGIAQKPSEPHVSIIDDNGNLLSYSSGGQKALEDMKGKQIPLDSRLELHQSLETELVFDVPVASLNLKAIIEEGPFITKFLFQGDKEVFLLK
jgi:hypothetical protein